MSRVEHISWRRRLGLVVASCLLVIVHLAMGCMGYRNVCLWLVRASPKPDPEKVCVARSRAYGRLVNEAAKPFPWANCLRRSMVVWWLLRWERIPSDIRFGVKMGEQINAHAWVEHHQTVINDVPHIAAQYPLEFSSELAPEQVVRAI